MYPSCVDRWRQEYRDTVIETCFWLVVVMFLVAILIGVLVELFLPLPPPVEAVSHFALQ